MHEAAKKPDGLRLFREVVKGDGPERLPSLDKCQMRYECRL